MKQTLHKAKQWYLAGAAILLVSVFNQGCSKLGDVIHNIEHKNPNLKNYKQVNLVANNNEYDNPHIDPHLLNAWGLAFSSNGIAWISSQAGHVSVVYDKDGNMVAARPEVAIPSPTGATGGLPTGTCANNDPNTADFVLSNGSSGRFFFVGLDGVISGWNPAAGNFALKIKTNTGSVYTGLTMLQNSAGEYYLYAANFSSGKIEVWNKNFVSVNLPFSDPGLPTGYHPYNIQAVGGSLYVMYAKIGADGRPVKAVGNGYVDVYTPNGILDKRFVSVDHLNAPWGVAWAPDTFFTDDDGNPTSAILVGNFGDGYINAYSLKGKFLGQLKGNDSKLIKIDGLWSLMFPPTTATTIDPNRLYFTAGPDNESDGLFGYLTK
jgi:uncharacterized protein (TIGR03118 family)